MGGFVDHSVGVGILRVCLAYRCRPRRSLLRFWSIGFMVSRVFVGHRTRVVVFSVRGRCF